MNKYLVTQTVRNPKYWRPRLMRSTIDECAREVLETVPLVMRAIRSELREHGAKELSVPQFRTLNFLSGHKGASLSEVADHIGLTLPSMSTLMEGLVTRSFAVRRTDPEDRRRVTLELTDRGHSTLRTARDATQDHLAGLLETLSSEDRGTITRSMRILKSIFAERLK
jgi:DNA-binding MarR family transcriptional regulator